MFGSLGLPELMLIFIVALIVFGPKRLPDIGKTLGKALGEFKKATDDFKNTIEREVRVEELKELRQIPTTVANALVVPPTETVSRAEPVTQMAASEPAPAQVAAEPSVPPAAPHAE
jgi:TatA/E family protein of Tat protein translocase